MQKTSYLKELVLSGTQSRNGAKNKKPDVLKIQSWLNLYAIVNPAAGTACAIDGDFGQATERAVKAYQSAIGIPPSGKVDAATFDRLCEPLHKAFTTTAAGSTLRDVVVAVANLHVEQSPFELVINQQSNSGPWVRSYMDGHNGTSWAWCMGFVQTIIDQAASQFGKSFRTLMPLTYNCDVVGTTGLQKKILNRYTTIRNDPKRVSPGDIFLVQKTPNDWEHTGIITKIQGDTFETIEGNTNTNGSSNGNGVYKRLRNFKTSKLDVFSIAPLTL